MILKCQQKTVFSVSYRDLEGFIQDVYGNKQYEFVCAEEVSNDIVKEYTINKKEEISDYNLKKLNSFKAGNFENWITRLLLQDMVNNDILQPCTYSIDVCW